MNATIPVPIWVFLVFALLAIAWQWAVAIQTRELRRLFQWYLAARSREPSDEELTDA